MMTSFDRSSQGCSQINQYEFTFEEAKDLVNMQITFLNKEEGILKEKLEILEIEKKEYLRTLRQVYDEENCRFGSRFKPSSIKDTLWDDGQRSISKQGNLKMGLSRTEPNNPLQSQSWPLLNNRYQLVSLLGKGGFSEVYKAYDLKQMKFVACKIHQLNPHWSLTSRSNYIRHALRENQVHRFLKHLNIVEHYDSVEIDSNSFCTILEYCNGPNLSTYLKIHKTLNEKEAKMIVRQILSGLLFLNQKHEAKIIHYDLKPQNILFNNGIPKISDFGLCKVMNNDDTKLELTSQGVGTYYYLPPECFIRDRDNPILISTKVDIWSLGVIFFEMLYGFRPFGHNLSQERIFKDGIMLKAHSVTFPNRPNVSEDTKNFIRRALAYHQEDRIDVVQAHQILHSK
jgi:tousled-like kinase